ncbi:MAG: acetyl-CoA carboxylase biotin carboxylase subunit [Oscillospiraceae bacterium]|jgi:acetyl-CoA carboxylase biotin carboxylase subunit|nr:acetyl-CoA carboxylase biotin carboxylase subunit [Oscillospiraceae bacterium]
MIKKLLIANRGEIAVRIIRAARELGISTVAVCSTADKLSLHAQIADETVCIGGPAARDSYLNQSALLAACEITGADAVHPGFGFLSENAAFARLCRSCGVEFIGPAPEVIEALGDKSAAKSTMKRLGIPVIPGSDGPVQSLEEAAKTAREIGYPVMVKASAGGGGRGIRIVKAPEELEGAMTSASQEALACFGDGRIYVEKFIENPRHVEIQVLGDKYGNVIHLGERDCSLQRRNQKMAEESPSPIMTEELRRAMGQAAVTAARAVGYQSAGTIEFLVDGGKNFYFMEMNTRIQVEHPVTELVTALDLVAWQLRIGGGEPLSVRQEDVRISGHAIECRINAEDPDLDFRPSPGTITALHIPGGPGVRIDSGVYQGYTITPYYDSMIAKLIVWAPDRKTALAKMNWALAEFLVEGVNTNIEFQLDLIRDPAVQAGDYDIGFIGRKLKARREKR